jgi:16S rRNA (guanine(966)-N(2))-methyltransferase RsmD
MRVIAGRFGGRRLSSPRGRTTRPTSDRVREATFALLGSVQQVGVLDLFAGTGALGIEALSRGAQRAVFVERDARAARALRANLESLGLELPEAEVREMDALAALRRARARRETYDLVFIDPPYRHLPALEQALDDLLPALLAPSARVVLESDTREQVELTAETGRLEIDQQRRYGDTTITIHRYA